MRYDHRQTTRHTHTHTHTEQQQVNLAAHVHRGLIGKSMTYIQSCQYSMSVTVSHTGAPQLQQWMAGRRRWGEGGSDLVSHTHPQQPLLFHQTSSLCCMRRCWLYVNFWNPWSKAYIIETEYTARETYIFSESSKPICVESLFIIISDS